MSGGIPTVFIPRRCGTVEMMISDSLPVIRPPDRFVDLSPAFHSRLPVLSVLFSPPQLRPAWNILIACQPVTSPLRLHRALIYGTRNIGARSPATDLCARLQAPSTDFAWYRLYRTRAVLSLLVSLTLAMGAAFVLSRRHLVSTPCSDPMYWSGRGLDGVHLPATPPIV